MLLYRADRLGLAGPRRLADRIGVILIVALLLIVSSDAIAEPGDADEDAPIRGVVRAINKAAVATDLTAPVAHIAYRAGDAFRKGDLLIKFDCTREDAALQASLATEHEMALNVQSMDLLKRHGAGGRIDLEIARARLGKAKGDADVLRARLKHCVFRAPFHGRVVDVFVNAHELPTVGKPFISIIDDSKLEIETIVPSIWLRWIKAGTAFEFQADETGQTYLVHVVRLGAVVDAVSQTVKVVATFVHQPEGVLAGMSGTASFQRPGG